MASTPTSTTTTTAVDLDGRELTLEDVEHVAVGGATVTVRDGIAERMASSRERVVTAAADETSSYGLNTGVGKLVDQRIPADQISELQHRVVRSHAAGVGEPYEDDVIRAAMLLRAATLTHGHSGVRPDLVDLLADMLNANVVPRVPARGSVGASGDLAPLSHIALCMIGEGKAKRGGDWVDTRVAFGEAGLTSIELEAKEGLSLINGTQFMTAMGTLALLRAERLAQLADLVCSLTVESLRGSSGSFAAPIHELRPHPGQKASAANMFAAMQGSSISESHRDCSRVQDAYSLRCAPQVHGASRDAFGHARSVLAIEAQSVTDNPLVFPDDPVIRSNGNFHGQPIAITLDLMAIAIAELASISERRTERLVNPSLSGGLPAFLAHDGGLNSGFMLAQYTAAALVSENKVLSHPASVDSIPTSAGQEDHVSMGNHGGLEVMHVLANAEYVIAVELLCAAQAVEFQLPRTPGTGAAAVHAAVRRHVPTMVEDRILSDDIETMTAALRAPSFLMEIVNDLDWELQ